MLTIHTETIGDLVILECEGRVVRSEAAFQLRDAVTSCGHARILVLDLSELHALEGGGLGMLVYLHRWADDQRIRLKLFNPTLAVRRSLERASPMYSFEIVSLQEMMALLALAEEQRLRISPAA
jgi:anti-anti-sigma regulatory factor